jgi:hypothetical protein
MALDTRIAQVFGLDEDAWQRHANPWSVYTRIPIPLLLTAAVWTRVWIGWWALVPVAAVAMWTMVNPRAFAPPRTVDSWASRGVLGEEYWSARTSTPIPARHRVAPIVLSAISAAGLPFWIWGLIALDPWITAFGLAIQMLGKVWFIDRMALLYDDVHASCAPECRPSRRRP